MTKRIYGESVKLWMIANGIATSGLIIGIFTYLIMVGAITPTGQNGDTFCSGTFEDPCYAYMNFTANEDIFLYPVGYDPWGRDTPFKFEPGLKDWKLQRSWGDGWRDIPLNDTCKGTWCGGKYGVTDNAYSYAFRKDKQYQIRIIAYKENPFQNIYWQGFDGVFDPWWNSSWTNCMNITIANIDGVELTDFKHAINISYESSMQADFDDLRFVDEACDVGGNQLSAELEYKVDSTNAFVWVNHTLPAVGDIISVYYGNSGASSDWTPETVWDGFTFVTHMSNSASTVVDSTSNNYDGTQYNTPTVTTGKFGQAVSYASGSSEYTNFGDSDIFNTGDFTLCAVVKDASSGDDSYYYASKYESANDRFYFRRRGDAGGADVMQFYNVIGGAAGVQPRGKTEYNSDFHLHCIVADRGTNSTVYRDGVTDIDTSYSLANTGDMSNSGNLYFGRYDSTYSSSVIDDFIVYPGLLSANWIKQYYTQIFSPASVFTFSAEESGEAPIVPTTDNFYISTDGDDSASGNITNPWKTITHLNTIAKVGGNTVNAKCGDSWNTYYDATPTLTDGSVGNSIKWQSYGDCTGFNKPELIGGPLTNFTYEGGDEWSSTATSTLDVGFIICNDSVSQLYGNKEATEGDVNIEGEFYYNPTTDKVYIHTADDLSLQSNCVMAPEDNAFDTLNIENVDIANFSIKYYGQHGIAGSFADDIIIDSVDIAFIGGAYQSGTLRYGNGIEFGLAHTDIIVRNCNVSQVYDAAYSSQAWSGDTWTIRNVTYSHNIGSFSAYNFEYFSSDASNTVEYFTVNQNTFVNSGLGWSSGFGNDGRALRAATTPADMTDWNYTNNLVDGTDYHLLAFNNDADYDSETTVDYNLYWNKSTNFGTWGGTTYPTFSAWQSASSKETHGAYADTLLNYTTYAPAYNSPACTMSSTGSYVGAVPCEDNPPDTTNPDITFDSPTSQTFNENLNVTLSVTCSDNVKVENISLYVNGTLNITNSTPVNNTAWVYDLTVADYTNYSINYICFDNSSNSDTSETRWFNFENSYVIDLELSVNNIVYSVTDDDITNLNVELNTPITINASLNQEATICIDINHSLYGINYSCSTNITSVDLEINEFTKDFLNDSTTEKNISFITGTTENQSVYINSHKYDDIDYLAIDITGFESGGSKPSNVNVYVGNILSMSLGNVFANAFELFDWTYSEFNQSFTESTTVLATTINMYSDAIVTSATMDISGWNYTYKNPSSDTTSTTGTFEVAAAYADDNNYATYATTDAGVESNIYWNYTHETGLLAQSVWEVKDFDDTLNISIPATCFDESILQFKANFDSTAGTVYIENFPTDFYVNWTREATTTWSLSGGNARSVYTSGAYGYKTLTMVPSFDLSTYDSASVTYKVYTPSPGCEYASGLTVDWSCDGGVTWDGDYYCDGDRFDWCVLCAVGCSGCNFFPDTWYTKSFDVETACGEMPDNFTIRFWSHFDGLDLNHPMYVNDIRINTESYTNITYSCYNGSSWEDLREVRYSGTNANDYAKLYEQKLYRISYPQSPWLEIGTINGTREWNYTGNFSLVSNTTEDFTTELNNYLESCVLDDDGFCNAPVYLHSDSIGTLELSELNVEYDYDVNPIVLDVDSYETYLDSQSEGFIDVPITFESDSNGTIEISNIKLYYAGGNNTYEIISHDLSYTVNESVLLTYYFSRFDYEYSPTGIDGFYVKPPYPTSKNVQPNGQTSTVPIFNVSNYAYGGKDFNFSIYINDSLSCVTSFTDTTTLINNTFVNLVTNSEYLDTFGLWFYFNFSCNYNNQKYWNPDWSFRACCVDCLCSDEPT